MLEKGFVLDNWHVEVDRGRISRARQTVRLEPQIMKVLVFLAEHHNEVVSKDRLMEALWSNTYIGDAALTRCICEIRNAFGDNSKAPHIVETIPKVGYRLIAKLGPLPENQKSKQPVLLWSAAAGVLAAAILFWGFHEQGPVSFNENALANAAYIQGLTYFDKGEFENNENAIAFFERALEHDAEFGLAHAGLAAALAHQLRYDGGDRREDARAAANKALELEPDLAETHNASGLVHWIYDDHEGALESFERAYTLEPDYWRATYNAAIVLRMNTEYKKAEALFLQTVENASEHVPSMTNLGFLYLRMGDVETADLWLSRAKDMAPMTIHSSAQIGVMEFVGGNHDGAVENCKLVLSYRQNHTQCLYIMGVSNLLVGNMVEAEKWFDYTASQIPQSQYARIGKAQVLLAEGKTDEGMRIVEQIREEALAEEGLTRDVWRPYLMVAATYALQGDEVKAFEWLDKAAESGRRFYLWDAIDPMLANLHGDQRFDRYIAKTMVAEN